MSARSRPRCSARRSRTSCLNSLSSRSSTSSMFSKSRAMCHLFAVARLGAPGRAAPLPKEQIGNAEREPEVVRPVAITLALGQHARSVTGDEVIRARVLDLVQMIGEVLSLIHISEPTRLLSISYAVF